MSGPVPDCLACARDWEHCHDTLVLHADGYGECEHPDCRLPAAQHPLVVDCAELRGCCG